MRSWESFVLFVVPWVTPKISVKYVSLWSKMTEKGSGQRKLERNREDKVGDWFQGGSGRREAAGKSMVAEIGWFSQTFRRNIKTGAPQMLNLQVILHKKFQTPITTPL
jgi:hypothetical protein